MSLWRLCLLCVRQRWNQPPSMMKCCLMSLSLFVTLYIFLHLTAMYSSTFGKWWVGRSCLYFLVWVSFGSFSLRELTCMHCVYLALWTRKVLCGSFVCAIYKFSFIHHSNTHQSHHTPSIAFRHLPPKEGCRKPVLGVYSRIKLFSFSFFNDVFIFLMMYLFIYFIYF